MKKIKNILFAVVVAPIFLWLFIHPGKVLSEWKNIPSYFSSNIHSLTSTDKLSKINEERWNAFGSEREDLLSKVYYNKGTALMDDLFSALSYLSPRIYFQSGEGSSLSPPRIEPIAIPLFLFWILGLVDLLRNKKFKPILLALLFALTTYIFGQRNMAFLFPIAIIYLFISLRGIEVIKSTKFRKTIYISLFVYGLYLLGRVFLLK